jgi:hypothetical protein
MSMAIRKIAAGLNAVTIVWVSRGLTDEHRAPLDWLNEITDERFNFFGLEVELWRIGDSPPAPKFNVVCKPNNWAGTIQDFAGGGGGRLSETGQARWSLRDRFRVAERGVSRVKAFVVG